MSDSALPFEGRVGPRCLDKKLRVHVTLPHPARCIFRRLFTNSDVVLEQARRLTNPARRKSLCEPPCLPAVIEDDDPAPPECSNCCGCSVCGDGWAGGTVSAPGGSIQFPASLRAWAQPRPATRGLALLILHLRRRRAAAARCGQDAAPTRNKIDGKNHFHLILKSFSV